MLPGSIVAANNNVGRHKTIILCKSNKHIFVDDGKAIVALHFFNPLWIIFNNFCVYFFHVFLATFCVLICFFSINPEGWERKTLNHLFMNFINEHTMFPH